MRDPFLLPIDPRTAHLRARIATLSDSLTDFGVALVGINDPLWREPFVESIAAGIMIVALHAERINPSIADDLASLRSQFARHVVPREDPQLGPLESLSRIRAARGSLLADIDEILTDASKLGLVPSNLPYALPTALEFERVGLENLLDAMGRRLRAVEDGLKAIEAEGQPDRAPDVRQIGLVNFFVNSMTVELALAKIEATAKAVIDFNNLGRAVEAMGELMRDFFASVSGMRSSVTQALRVATAVLVPKVRRLGSGLHAIIGKVRQTRMANLPRDEPEDEPSTLAFWTAIEQGDEARLNGGWETMKRCYSEAESLAIAAVQEFATSSKWQRNLSVSYNRLGDVEVAAGDLGAARARFEAGLAIAERLAAREPGNSEWQRDLSVSYNKLGDVEVAAGDLGAARARFEAGLAIAERLAAREPGNSEWQRDLSVSYNRIGDMEVAAGDLGAARARFGADLAIAETLATREPGNSEWQRDLSVSYGKLGDVEVAAGDLGAARARFEAGFAIFERLATREPGNSQWQRDLSVSYGKLGDVEVAAGDLEAARARFEAGLAIRERLTAREPDNSQWQLDLSVSYDRLGDVEVTAGDLGAARARFEACLAIRETLAAREPGNSQWQRDLTVSYDKFALLAERAGDMAAALGWLRKDEAVMAALAERRPDHPGFAKDLAWVRREIARLGG